ncbi:phospho-N-acetylmuramoyl-pentapeptide-transferase [Deinococcus ruber]|uniref:Phospho-N-acetylmuramoyl-pentapeptide-transferase n=1 Tax=Deinococcus ruber TaxID=1848197 RepID=A0A918CHQ2_9DEIO|nr:phospho-N-acetylmuramoyl-pentapeptide-transferase [Deinococcus ruber]GGR24413.1 phospho-N-acetylmuramoyl-pentapeptide-transferase [Deinococcus ruber]
MMVVAALLSWFLVGLFIMFAKRYGWGQPIRQEGPQTHLKKEGTPTAGGIGFVLAMVLCWLGMYLTGHGGGQKELLLILAALGMGAIGLVDDLLKIRSRMVGGKKELLAREKFPLQFLVGLIFAIFAAPLAPHTWVHGLGLYGDIVLYTLVMVGAVNAFNFTDGLDGLLGGVSIIVLLPLLGVSPVSVLMVGVILGFLWFNAHPARVFMGDMGSHAIGGVAAGAYILHADVWLLPISAVIPVVAVLSVVLQVLYFRRTGGKRLFRMSPIQHHFEELGWPETHVTLRFWIITALGTALVWSVLRGTLPVI